MVELLNIESIVPYECCVIAGISMYENQKTKNSVTLRARLHETRSELKQV